jgi:VCBS repeat-containing protein
MVDYNNNTGTGTGTTTTTPGSTTGSTTNTGTAASPTGGTTTNPAIWTGTSGSDSKTGTAANETFNGLGGNDTIDGGGGNDTIDGGEGADTIRGGDGNDAIRGGRGGGDKLFGDAGDDAIIAVGGGSVVEGGAGNDYLFGFGDDRLLGGEGDDWIEIIDGSPYKKLDGNTGKTDFTGFIQNISGGAGTDTFVVRPNGGLNQFSSELIAALRDASFERYAFNEKFETDVQLVLDADGYVIWEPDEHGWPTETVTVTAPKYSSVTSIYDLNSRLVAESRIRFSDGLREGVEHDFYDTNAWKTRTKTYDATGRLVSMVETPDSPAPTARNDTLSLQEGTDDPAITTTTGNLLANDTGAEKKLLSVGTATVAEFGETVIQGTYGALRVKQDGSYVFVLDNLRANVEALAAGQSVADVFSYRVGNDGGAAGATLTITINGANDVSIARTLTTARDVVSGTASAERIDALAGNDEISAGGGNDVVRGGDGDDVIKGDAGSDALFGDGGHDWLDGGAGNDRADGGAGNDFIFYDQADDWANGGVMGGAGTDVLVLREADGWRLHPAYDPSSIGQIVSRADGTHFTAAALAAAGFERFALMTADNAGQPWAERYQIYQGVSRVGERTVFDDGRIEFRTFDFDNSQVWLEKIETTEPGKQAVTQTILDPVLRGGAGNDIIEGTSGTDTLEGGAGNDTLNGGGGQDFLDGGDGLNRGNIKGGAGTDILALTADQVTAVKPLLVANGFERYAIVSRDGVVPTDKANNKFPWKELAEVFDLDGTSLFTRITSDKDMVEIREGYRKPVANGEAVLVTEDVAAAATGNLLANDPGLHLASASLATVNGETPRRLSVTSIDKPDGAKPGSLSSVTVTEGKYGFLSVDTQGNYSYRHNNALAEINALNDGQSLTDSFVYTLSDGLLNANATLVVTIRGKTDAAAGSRPVAENVTATATEDAGQDVTGNLLTHGSGQNRTVSLIDTSAVSANSSTIIQGTYGQLTVIADGTYKYSLDESRLFGLNNGQTGSEEFAYTVKNGTGQTATATLAIAVEGRTDPLTRPDEASISENATTPVTGNLFANDRPGNKSIASVGTRQRDSMAS